MFDVWPRLWVASVVLFAGCLPDGDGDGGSDGGMADSGEDAAAGDDGGEDGDAGTEEDADAGDGDCGDASETGVYAAHVWSSSSRSRSSSSSTYDAWPFMASALDDVGELHRESAHSAAWALWSEYENVYEPIDQNLPEYSGSQGRSRLQALIARRQDYLRRVIELQGEFGVLKPEDVARTITLNEAEWRRARDELATHEERQARRPIYSNAGPPSCGQTQTGVQDPGVTVTTCDGATYRN